MRFLVPVLLLVASLTVSAQTSGPKPSASPAPATADLTTVSGKVYKHARVFRVEPDGITFMYDGGMSKIDFTDLPEAVRKQHGYDPAKASAFAKADAEEQRLAADAAQAEQARLAERRKAERDLAVNGPPAELHTLEEVETDQPSFVDRRVKLKGKLAVDNYYNFKYADCQFSHLAFRLTDEKGHRAALYLPREAGQKIRDMLLRRGPTLGVVTIRISPFWYDPNASDVFADILGFVPDSAGEKSEAP